jgi:hypothetical protein
MAQTNAQLEGAALNSKHLQAKAFDIQLPSVDNDAVAVDFRKIVCGGSDVPRPRITILVRARCSGGSARGAARRVRAIEATPRPSSIRDRSRAEGQGAPKDTARAAPRSS